MTRVETPRAGQDVVFERFFVHALDLLCVADTAGYFRRVNQAWERALGWTAAEMMARPYLDFVHPDDVEVTREAAEALARQEAVVRFVNRFRGKSGGYRRLEWSSVTAGDDGLIYATARDVTDLASGRRLDFYQALDFHGFKGKEPPPGQPVPALAAPAPDFHEAVALLADYPALLRKLGLVFDLVVPAPTQPFTRLRVRPALSPALSPAPAPAVEHVTPWTAVRYQAGAAFEPAAQDPAERRGGFFDLARPEVGVTQVDVDGAALKLITYVESALMADPPGHLGRPERAGLPALRSGGLAVSLTDRAGRLRRRLLRAGALHDAVKGGHGDEQVLYAEDLTRGLRVDVHDAALGRWCSLHRRRPALTLAGPRGPAPLDPGVAEDEGVLTAAVASPTDPAKGDDLYLHETLFHWTGWSLSAERPGARVDLVGDGVAPSSNPAVNALGLAARHRVVPGSLPRLRFGRVYRVRARVVDLAGNSLPHDHPDAGAATPEAPYLRFEPVPAPTLSREAEPRPGESMDRVVIRSFNATPADDLAPTAEVSARGVFPPKGAVVLAEQHGLFDDPTGAMAADPATYQRLAARDPVQPPEVTPAPTSASPLPLAAYAYLPDPLARGVRVRGLPGGDVDVVCASTWPEVHPFRIALQDGPAAAAWDAARRTLVVSLPKGQEVTLRLSSLLPGPEALDALGLWRWLAARCPPAYLPELRRRALAGELWALAPDRAIRLVHAVQRPLRDPAFAALELRRAAGQAHVDLRAAALALDAASTGEVEVVARWSDRVDRSGSPTGDGWEAHEGRVGRVVIAPGDDAPALLGLRHELPDTRYRRVSYHAVATSRFRECFLGAPAPLDLTRVGAAVERDVLASARPAAPDVDFILPTFGWSAEASADGVASRRRGLGVRVYLERPWFSSGDGELLGVVVAHGPRVDYADGVGKIEASWLGGHSVPEVPARLRGLVTLWGADPIWVSAPAWPTPSLHHFPSKAAQLVGAALDELDGASPEPGWSVAVAGHAVACDAELQRWY